MGSPCRRLCSRGRHPGLSLASLAVCFYGIVSELSFAFGVPSARSSSLYLGDLAAQTRKPAAMLRKRQVFPSRRSHLHRRRVGRAADSTSATAPPPPVFKMFPDDYQPGIFDPVIRWLTSFTNEQAEVFEVLYFAVIIVLTIISAKTNYDAYIVKKTEDDEVRRQKIRRAINPETWREELYQEDQMKKRRKEEAEQGKTSSKVREVLGEIYGSQVDETDGLEDNFNVKLETRAGRARRNKKNTA
eukprot:TRINITY_DN14191_c0_g2_i1.p1 TRINITY_DN14191_c0_g2~~TRINITY_DN14191_c0_g2_i1.p1  ORF type:complete len:244 (+),score=33.28 TRINITY_DN14191_c0_g2_i1:26-757(+)